MQWECSFIAYAYAFFLTQSSTPLYSLNIRTKHVIQNQYLKSMNIEKTSVACLMIVFLKWNTRCVIDNM